MTTTTYGDPRLPHRFWAKVQRDGACWLWTGATTKGYGRAKVAGVVVLTHRHAYEALCGPIPEGMGLDHLCRRRACCNPACLEPVPNRTNALRGVGPTSLNAVKTHCLRGHEFTPHNTVLRGGRRYCQACVVIRHAARKAAA